MSDKKYNHAFTFAFSVPSCPDADGERTSANTLKCLAWLLRRIADCIEPDGDGYAEMHEAIGLPFDTYEEEA